MGGLGVLKGYLAERALRQADAYLAAGKQDKAARLYQQAGAFHQAARAAIEIGDERRAVECSLRAGLGRVPDDFGRAGALQAAELLSGNGHHSLALGLFELAGADRQAAEAAKQLHRWSRAAHLYERAKLYAHAAACYDQAGQLDAALRMLEIESQRLRRNSRSRPGEEITGRLGAVEVSRAELLRRLDRTAEAAEVLQGVKPTPASVDLLEEAGKIAEAIEACLKIGDGERAARLLRKDRDLDRSLVARVYLGFGRPLEAANVFAAAGLAREAAEAYEAGGDWPKAGSRWEAAQEQARAAHAYQEAGRNRDAARCFAAAGEPLRGAECCAKAGDHVGAAELFLKGGQPMNAATSLLTAGDRPGAARALMQVQPGDADFLKATLALIPLLLDEGLTAQALSRTRQLPPRERDTARQLLYRAAESCEKRGQTAHAEELYRGLLDLSPGDAGPQRRLRELVARRDSGAGPQAAAAAGAAAARPAPPERLSRTAPPGPAPVVDTGAALDRAPTVAAAAGRSPAAMIGASGASAASAASAAAPVAAFPGLAAGQLLAGRYELLGELGRGGMARVYKAHDRELDELVAIKTLLGLDADDADTERLLREAQICRKITHPNVVRVFDLGRYAGGIFITMELLEVERMDALNSPERRLPLARIKGILEEIGAGLAEAHALGIVHRDLKPGNIILTQSRLKILDFGIARDMGVEKRLTKTGFALGSVLYISPEQLQSATPDCRADLYALGVVAYALLAGREPFDGTTAGAIVLQHLRQPPPDLGLARPGLPAGWVELVYKLLAKQPADRYQSIGEMLAALAPLPVEPVSSDDRR
jgi:tRNA A-37 threonylcarbamoyl transferase component Bud32/tetratricopeptide (TPR) repeat protein